MKKIIVLLSVVCMATLQMTAQNLDCMGLKNPTNFTFTGGNASSSWSGATGSKDYAISYCNSLGMSFSTTIAAGSLESQSSGSSCTSSSSVDIHGNSDTYKRFVIKGSGTDPLTYNHLSYLPPTGGFTSSIRLGNNCGGTHEAEQLTYEFEVNNNNKLVTIWYALSLQNGQHATEANPEFVIQVKKQVGSNWVLAAGDTLCYTRPTPDHSNSDVTPFYVGSTGTHTGASYECNIYLPWTKVLINLDRLNGSRVRIIISTGDCNYSAHYGCCYLAGDCESMSLNTNGCAAGSSDTVATVSAPSGATTYQWYRSKTGVLQGAERTSDANYQYITRSGANRDTLSVIINDFINTVTQDTMAQTTVMCKMTTYMNPNLPVVSRIYAEIGNTKPTIQVDSTLECDASITLRDLSFARFLPAGTENEDRVDTTLSQWTFYSSSAPTAATLDTVITGGTAKHTFAEAGNYCVELRTSAHNTTCWNSKVIPIRVMKSPEPVVRVDPNDICSGDTIVLYNQTPATNYHMWIFHNPDGEDTVVTAGSALRRSFDTITPFTLLTHTSSYHTIIDENGNLQPQYCYAEIDSVVHVEQYPELQVIGDTIVCNGTQAIVDVTSNEPNAHYDWYTSMQSSNPLQQNTSTLTTTPTHDMRYYVKATTPFGCTSWDSINIYIIDPHLEVPVVRICDNEEVKLYASNAYSYTWTSTPDDPSLVGQDTAATITVMPHVNTTYTLVGHGMNNCSATPLSQTITVLPYPIPTFEMSPDFIDSEEPVVTFRDVSPGAVSSLWDFGSGNTSTERQVRHTFTDLSQDSVQITLTSSNDLGCSSDTSFYVPVELFSVWFPNAITPTLSTNRTFKCFTGNELEYYTLYIYDRHGTQLFYTNDPAAEWDASYNGERVPQGVYVYVCTYRRPGTTDIVTQRGTITVIE